MKNLILALTAIFSLSLACAQNDISKFEGTWLKHYQPICDSHGKILIGPHTIYIRIQNTDGKIIVRMKNIDDTDGHAIYYKDGSGVLSGNTLEFTIPAGSDYNYDNKKVNGAIVHYSKDFWKYKAQIKNGALSTTYDIYMMYYNKFDRYLGDESLPMRTPEIFYNENDNW